MSRKSRRTMCGNQPGEEPAQIPLGGTGSKAKHDEPPTEKEDSSAVTAGRLRPGFELQYHEAIDLYLPLIGSDAFALYCVYLRFRHGDKDTDKPGLLGHAWPGDRTVARLLRWSRSQPKGKLSRIWRAREVLVAADLIDVTTVDALLSKGVITMEQARTLVRRRISEKELRQKLVVLVYDPLERRHFRRAEERIREKLARVEERFPRRKPPKRNAHPGSSDEPVETAPHMARPTSQGQARSASHGAARPTSRKQTSGKHPEDTDPKQQPAVVGVLWSCSSQAVTTRDLLAAYRILEPTRTKYENADPQKTLAWIMYFEDQESMPPELRRSTLIARLRDGDEPPPDYLTLAGISQEALRWLTDSRSYRMDHGYWPENDGGLPVSLAAAETWLRYVLERDRQLYVPPVDPPGDADEDDQPAEDKVVNERFQRARVEAQVREQALNVLHLLDGNFADRQRAREVIRLWHESGLEATVFRKIVAQAAQRAEKEHAPGSRVSGFFRVLPGMIREHVMAVSPDEVSENGDHGVQ